MGWGLYMVAVEMHVFNVLFVKIYGFGGRFGPATIQWFQKWLSNADHSALDFNCRVWFPNSKTDVRICDIWNVLRHWESYAHTPTWYHISRSHIAKASRKPKKLKKPKPPAQNTKKTLKITKKNKKKQRSEGNGVARDNNNISIIACHPISVRSLFFLVIYYGFSMLWRWCFGFFVFFGYAQCFINIVSSVAEPCPGARSFSFHMKIIRNSKEI